MTKNNNHVIQDLSFISHLNSLKPIRQPEKYISKWINGRRIMPQGGPFPGIYNIFRTPFIIEPCDNMGPYSPVVGQAMKKGVQISCTTIVENCIAYYWKERPVNQIYLSGTDDLLKDFEIERLTPLMASAGLVATSTEYKEKGRKTGDTVKRKDYYGGSFLMGSLQSGAMARSKTAQIMYNDEIDLVNIQMSSGEGNRLKVFDGRLVAFGERAKSFSLSTPREFGNSLIDLQYDRGDKRKYMVPCPHCGKYQWLCLGDEKSNFGLKGDYKGGALEMGYYLCFHCHQAIFEGHKEKMLKNGFWKPSIEHSLIKNYRSYHLPSFYSPFMSWTKMHQEHKEAEELGDDGMRSFTNLYLGKSFEPSGERPDLKTVIHIRSKYKSGEVPYDVMYLTCAGDVQRGSDKFKKYTNADILTYVKKHTKKKDWKKLAKLPRLEVEVMGHGRDRRTASIIYKKFYGQVDDYTCGAWSELTNWFEDPNGFNFKRRDGFIFPVQYILIDSGWGKHTDLVYNYCERVRRAYACKGIGTRKQDKLKLTNIDEIKSGNIQRYKLSESNGYSIILINTNYYKGWLYRNLKNISKGNLQQLPNSHITPADYPDSYFDGLRAEKQKTDGSFHNPARRPNEPTDTWVYNVCASDFFIDNMILTLQEKLKHKYPALRARSLEAKEKLRELANRTIVMDNLEAQLRKEDW